MYTALYNLTYSPEQKNLCKAQIKNNFMQCFMAETQQALSQ